MTNKEYGEYIKRLKERDEPMAIIEQTLISPVDYKRTKHYRCPRCGDIISLTYKFCPQCGQALDTETISFMEGARR